MNLLAVHPVNDIMAVACQNSVIFYQIHGHLSGESVKLLARHQLPFEITRLCVNPDLPNCFIATLIEDFVAILFLECDEEEKYTVQCAEQRTGSSTWGCCGDDKYLVASSNDWNIRVYNNADNSCTVLSGHSHNIPSVEMKEGLLVSSSIDGSTRVWDLDSGKSICTFKGTTWGWSSHLIRIDTIMPTAVNYSEEFIVRKLAKSELPFNVPSFVNTEDMFSSDPDDVGVSVPEDDMIMDDIEEVFEERHLEDPHEDIEEQVQDPEQTGFTLELGDNVYSSVWEIAPHPDLEDAQWDTSMPMSTSSHRNHSDTEFDSFASDSDQISEDQKSDKNDCDEELYKEKLFGKYLIAFISSTDFYLLAADDPDSCSLTPTVHKKRLLHSIISPDQRALLLNSSLIWSFDRLAFSIFIEDMSVVLCANQMGFVIAIRVVDQRTTFTLAFPRADEPVYPITGISCKRLENIPTCAYIIYILRLSGTIDSFILRCTSQSM